MRWTTPQPYEERVIVRFPILPRLIEHDVRWLEIVYIKQFYSKFKMGWIDIRYVTKEDYIKYKGERELNEPRNS